MTDYFVYRAPVPYPVSLEFIEKAALEIAAGRREETVLLREHPALYTAGIHAAEDELLSRQRPVFKTDRGGKYTFHGPGQRVMYVLLNLRARKTAPRDFVWGLEETGLRALADFGLKAGRRDGRVGLWIETPDGRESKIAALGVRIRRGVTLHGMAINICPDLSLFSGIIPCGIREYGVASMAGCGIRTTSAAMLDDSLMKHFNEIFG